MSIYAPIYCAKETANLASNIDERKLYSQLNYRQEMLNKGYKLKELAKTSVLPGAVPPSIALDYGPRI